MEALRLNGSQVTTFKTSVTKHIVSHTMVFDESIWTRQRHEKNPKKEAYVEMENLASPLFTADDDGEVFFQIKLSKLPLDEKKGPASKPTYRININLETKPLPITVHYSSYYEADFDAPVYAKDDDTPFDITVHPNETKGAAYITSKNVVKPGDRGFRLDTTYLKVNFQVDQKLTPVVASNGVVKPKRCFGTDLLNDPAFSDLTLKANEQEWKLHKCVLCNRSDVFAAMFASDMKEATDGVVEIKDADSKALDLMIKYIYTDTIDIDDLDQKTAEELVMLAEKYNLLGLKETCAVRLISQLSVENCLHLVSFANKYDSPILLATAKKMLANNLECICRSQTNEYKNFVKENLDLSIDVVLNKHPNTE